MRSNRRPLAAACLAVAIAATMSSCGSDEPTAEETEAAQRAAIAQQDVTSAVRNAAVNLEMAYIDGGYPTSMDEAAPVLALPDTMKLGGYELLNDGEGYVFCVESLLEPAATVYDTDGGVGAEGPEACAQMASSAS